MGGIADVPIPRRLRRPVLRAFARSFGIDASEALGGLDDYATLNAFFVRRLRPGSRSWPGEKEDLASPVDGIIGQVGIVQAGRAIQAKGRSYTAADLLASEEESVRYEGGFFLTLYLAPRHYHRIHAPLSGTIALARHVPGRLLPVNAASVAHIDDLLPRNERVICFSDGALGRLALVAIGAYNVGRISVAFDEEWSGGGRRRWITNRTKRPPAERRYAPPVAVERGEELMAFHLGSTVVMLLEPGRVELSRTVTAGAEVRLGSPLARATGDARPGSTTSQDVIE